MNTIIVKDEIINLIESLQYEVDARKDLIAFMISKNFDTSTDSFKRYQKEYMEFYTQYNAAKNELENLYLKKYKNKKIMWNLDFNNKTLTIQEIGE